MSERVSADVDETARIILLDGSSGPVDLARRLREHHDVTTLQVASLWERYMGFDGRVAPTHDIATGLRR